jgi:hypothetical protein
VLFVHLFARIIGLLVLALLPLACYLSYLAGQEYLAATERCVASPSPVVVHVSRADVAYARAQGWPRELSRGDALSWSVVSLDRSATGRRVERVSRRFCSERRFRLVARR